MTSKEQDARMDESVLVNRQRNRLKLKDVLQFLSSLLLPLALGVFTIVITFQQQEAAKQQREGDQRAAELQREQERNLDEQRYQNERFDTYIKEMGDLLEKHNGSIISSEVAATLGRVKTLNIFRQLDPQRTIGVIRFLYEAKQLTNTQENHSLDLSTANLLDIDFRDTAINAKQLDKISLKSISLSNATFVGIKMSHVNFSGNQFYVANFSLGRISDADFSFTIFNNANFSPIQLDNVNFLSTELNSVNFSFGDIRSVYFESSSLRSINFSFASLINARLPSAQLEQTNFSCAQLFNVSFVSARLENIDFSHALLNNVDFSSATLLNVNFSHTRLHNVRFPTATLQKVNFLSAELSYPNFEKARLQNTSFSSAILVSANFQRTQASFMNFGQTTAVAALFDLATLTSSNFSYSNIKLASFSEVKELNETVFSGANLYKVQFNDTEMIDTQLESALSIQDAVLPNETLAHDENLIKNGKADCNTSLISDWTLSNVNVTVIMSSTSKSNCQFTLQSLSSGAAMKQRVNLYGKWDSNSWPYSQAVLRTSMSIGITMELRGINSNNLVVARQSLILPTIPANAKWVQGVTVAGGNVGGSGTNQLNGPGGLFIDDDQTVLIADAENHRIMRWKKGDTTNGQVVAGGNGGGNRLDQLDPPTDVLIDKETNSLIICDLGNSRVVRWSRRNGTTQGEILIDNIDCLKLAMDEQRYLYVSDYEKNEVRRYQLGDKNGTLVAGGNGKGNGLNQLNYPTYLFVDRHQNVYVSDHFNHRVMKWNKGAKEGIVVAGGQGYGDALTQLCFPNGLFVDTLGTLYVADSQNYRVMRWTQGAKQGTVIVGGNGVGAGANQLSFPMSLSSDRHGNLYVADNWNHRVQRFSLG
ncbi:unnamed protein product [Rotaria magnacalcarata]|uniref:Uncharacterized protein n=2 Tax=Rotaria magnacalcarata TaxID=392030 RepID=A0A817A2T1_9BILA|nr:unnamed protein product [Rotaria magnacalcarata]